MERTPHNPNEPTRKLTTLSPPDANALDHWMGDREPSDDAAPSADDAQRQAVMARLLGLIGKYPAEPPSDDLVRRTLARIDAAARRRQDMQVHDRPAPQAIAFRWSELIAVAAVLLIGMSLLWPVLSRTRSDATRVACATNLSVAGQALGHYAFDHRGVIPRYQTHAGAVWWNVGQPVSAAGFVQSNSANLFLLCRSRYIDPGTLACPENAQAPRYLAASAIDWPNAGAVSYSYQNQFTPAPVRLNRSPNLIVLADKNPLFTPDPVDPGRLRFDTAGPIDLNAPGQRHMQPGQNYLQLSGRVDFQPGAPIINDDNFYTVQGVNQYTGHEIPTELDDAHTIP